MNQRSFSSASALIVALAIVAVAVFSSLINTIITALQTGLEKSASIRVAKAESTCPVSSDDVHFVGCSSIL